MNPQIDKLIADIDAVINGEAPGAAGSGDLAPEVKGKMRALLQPVVIDCRVCAHHFINGGERDCSAWPTCCRGSRFEREEAPPLWEMQP